MRRLFLTLALLPTTGFADSIVASRNIRPETILTSADFTVLPETIDGAADHPDLVLGMEARIAIYAGRPIRPEDLGPPALVDRNQIVILHFITGTLSIQVEARTLDRGGYGDVVRVMNLASRTTITGIVEQDGSIKVTAPQG